MDSLWTFLHALSSKALISLSCLSSNSFSCFFELQVLLFVIELQALPFVVELETLPFVVELQALPFFVGLELEFQTL